MSARRTVEALTPLVDTRISGREQRPRALAPLAEPAPSLGRERARRAKFLSKQAEKTWEEQLARTQPAYIHACFNNPDRAKTYWVYTWKPDAPELKKRIPYTCGSWRCQHCREHAGHVLYARLQEAFYGVETSGVVFAVLTLDPKWHRTAAHDLPGVYREFSRRQNRWMKRLRRWLLETYGHDFGNAWASVTECHKSGVPHVNIAIHHAAWASDLRVRRKAMLAEGLPEFEAIQAEPVLLEHAQECGFGWRCTIEANRYGDTEAISGYLVKGVKNADRMHAEIAKLSQLPLMAPKNFRRLRAGKGFVPPKHKGECTGTVIRRYRSPEGDEQTEPLSRPVFPPEPDRSHAEAWELWRATCERKRAYLAEVQHAVDIEQTVAWRDEGRRMRHVPREELVQTYVRRSDGATSLERVIVLSAPKVPIAVQLAREGPGRPGPARTLFDTRPK